MSGGIILGTQYYRPPFPDRRFWADDMRAMRTAGLNTVQLWAVWGWIEPEPGKYRWEDYDELVDLAGRHGLDVVISTIAEVQPFWVHRVLPDATMVDHMGRTVVSSLRRECNVGLTPGGCIDHPDLRERIGAFLGAISSRYGSSDTLTAWDCWNELRWAVQADGHVCYCPHTVSAFRDWLRTRYQDIDGLNRAWRRRYSSWEDVAPGKLPGRPYTDLVEFEAFLTWRASEHMAFRRRALLANDTRHPIFAHGGMPATYATGGAMLSDGRGNEQALSRGSDWRHTDILDGFGCSHFPFWSRMTSGQLATRLESTRSAAQGKPWWISELQGAITWAGDGVSQPVPGDLQQSWVWSGLSRGAKAALFWCWRDEVFGWESASFGFAGDDGQAASRTQAMQRTRRIIDADEAVFRSYQPDPPQVGVLFEERSYQLDWADAGAAVRNAGRSLQGYLLGLERIQVPYEVVDSRHLRPLSSLKLLILPWPKIVTSETAEAILAWVKEGGILLAEAELDAFDERGFYRYAADRSFASGLGLCSQGRRPTGDGRLVLDLQGDHVPLKVEGLREVYETGSGEVLASSKEGEAMVVRRQVGKGHVIALGSYAGAPYFSDRDAGFERFLREVVRMSGAWPALRVSCEDGDVLQWRLGHAQSDRVLFLLNQGDRLTTSVHLPGGLLRGSDTVVDLASGASHTVAESGTETVLRIELPRLGVAVLRWKAEPAL